MLSFFSTSKPKIVDKGLELMPESVHKDTDLQNAFHFRRLFDRESLKPFIGNKVILISNNWDDMIFATGSRIEDITASKQPVLIVRDALSNEELVTFSHVLFYSREMLEALFKLTPYERWNMVSRQVFPHQCWNSKEEKPLMCKEDTIDRLRVAGFY